MESTPHCDTQEARREQERLYSEPEQTPSYRNNEACGSQNAKALPKDEMASADPPTPCKVLTHLAENPSADITQMPVKTDSKAISCNGDGVECSSAYRMLMQYATSEEKLDTISRALEGGCTANKGPGGGCRVQNKVIWKALDDVQK